MTGRLGCWNYNQKAFRAYPRLGQAGLEPNAKAVVLSVVAPLVAGVPAASFPLRALPGNKARAAGRWIFIFAAEFFEPFPPIWIDSTPHKPLD
jgi:hypothetical protein